MRSRKQAGQIIRIGDSWYVRHWERRNVAGSIERKRVTHQLGPVTTRGKRPPADIVTEGERYMTGINARTQTVKPEYVVTTIDFFNSVYLLWARAALRLTTLNGYEDIWETHLKGHFADRLLRDYRPCDATVFLTGLAGKGMGLHAVNHVRALMSGVFKHAAALGYINSNPVHLAKVLIAPRPPKETLHYTILEMATALSVLQNGPHARIAMALAFIGLRPSEINGLRWEDIDLGASKLHTPLGLEGNHQ